jgi:hypothetical protein
MIQKDLIGFLFLLFIFIYLSYRFFIKKDLVNNDQDTYPEMTKLLIGLTIVFSGILVIWYVIDFISNLF